MAANDSAFLQSIWTDQESDKDDIESITKYINMENELQSLFESKGKNQWIAQTYEQVWNVCPPLSLQEIRKWSIDPYALTLAQPYIEHSTELKFWKHKKLGNVFRIKGLVSRFVITDSTNPKKYTVLLKNHKERIQTLWLIVHAKQEQELWEDVYTHVQFSII